MSMQAQTEYCVLLESAARKLEERSVTTCAWLARFIQRVARSLARPARIVLLGETNAGKSSLANLLIGEQVVPTSVVENSRFPIHFHYAPRASLEALLGDGRRMAVAWSDVDEAARCDIEAIRVGLPLDRLKLFEIVDTPGGSASRSMAARLRGHAQLACLPIWCTVAARAWKESERAAWTGLPAALRARAILAVTQTDLLPNAADIDRVLDRLADETAGLFGRRIPIAIPQALSASTLVEEDDQGLWTSSGGEGLETVLTEALDDIARQRVAAARRVLNGLLAREQERSALAVTRRVQLAAEEFEQALPPPLPGTRPMEVFEQALPPPLPGTRPMEIANDREDAGVASVGMAFALRHSAQSAAALGLSEITARAS